MSEVQVATLRASLVVLSCFRSGRGRILTGEGVVGIAHLGGWCSIPSYLGGLCSSCVRDPVGKKEDEITMLFLKCFYEQLRKGKTTSAAV